MTSKELILDGVRYTPDEQLTQIDHKVIREQIVAVEVPVITLNPSIRSPLPEAEFIELFKSLKLKYESVWNQMKSDIPEGREEEYEKVFHSELWNSIYRDSKI